VFGDTAVAGYAAAVSPIHVNFTCDAVPSVSLADANGRPAWIIRVKKNDPIAWEVTPSVTIDSIVSKDSIPLPLNPNGAQGGGPGTPYRSRVKNSNNPSRDYKYNIFATCNTGAQAPLKLRIDPEMIIP
jgi:hypothetical protein